MVSNYGEETQMQRQLPNIKRGPHLSAWLNGWGVLLYLMTLGQGPGHLQP